MDPFMKIKISISCISALLVIFTLCKKESSNTIVGQWRSVSVYALQDNGTYNWIPVDRYPQFYNFSTEGRFGSGSDVAGPSGNYSYDEGSQKLTLHYEADRYGNVPGTDDFRVEMLDRDKLILAYPSPGNYKTEYSRIN